MTESRWTAATATLRRVAFDTNSLIYFFEAAQPRAGLVAHVLSRVESRQAREEFYMFNRSAPRPRFWRSVLRGRLPS